jgi:hypothetical protein
MKTSLIPFLMLFSIATYAQTDSIFTHNEILTGKIKSIGATHLVYVPAEMTVEFTLNLLTVKKVRFENGKVIQTQPQPKMMKIDKKIVQKPKLHFNPDELLGFHAASEEFFASRALFFFVPLNYVKKRMYQKIENRAILMNCNHVLIHTENAVNWQPLTFKSTNVTAQFYNIDLPTLEDKEYLSDLVQETVNKSIEYKINSTGKKIHINDRKQYAVKNIHEIEGELYVDLLLNIGLKAPKEIEIHDAKIIHFTENSMSVSYKKDGVLYRVDLLM